MEINMQRREIWGVGSHLFMLGDMEAGDLNYFVNKIPNKIDMVLTDPPWNKGLAKTFRTVANKYDTTFNAREVVWDSFIMKFAMEVGLINPKVLWVYMSISDTQKFINALQPFIPVKGMVEIESGFGKCNFIFFTHEKHYDLQAPVLEFWAMADWALKNKTGSKCETVLDMFMGNGSTAMEVLKTDKTVYGMDINKKKLEKCVGRVSRKTGDEPVLLG